MRRSGFDPNRWVRWWPAIVVPGANGGPRRRHRARPCKTELDVSLCFAPLLRWVLAWWRSDRLAMAVDPTLKGDGAIVISVVYRGYAIPVAWRILRANHRGAWMDPIVELLQALPRRTPGK